MTGVCFILVINIAPAQYWWASKYQKQLATSLAARLLSTDDPSQARISARRELNFKQERYLYSNCEKFLQLSMFEHWSLYRWIFPIVKTRNLPQLSS